MGTKLLGRVSLKVNGQTILSKRGSTLDPGGEKRTPVVGSSSVHGFSAELMPPMVTCKITQTANLAVTDVAAISDATLLWQGDDGISYVLTGAWCMEPPKLAEVDGEMDVQFCAMTCERV